MTAATLEQRTTSIVAAEAAAQLEAERLASRQSAIESLERVDTEWQATVPDLEQTTAKAKAKWERAQKAVEEAAQQYNRAGHELDLKRSELSTVREKALRIIALTADGRWDEFERELRAAGAKALATRYDLVTTHGPFGPHSVDRSRVEHNANAKAFWQSCKDTAEQVRARKVDPNADAETEIPKLRAALPIFTAN